MRNGSGRLQHIWQQAFMLLTLIIDALVLSRFSVSDRHRPLQLKTSFCVNSWLYMRSGRSIPARQRMRLD